MVSSILANLRRNLAKSDDLFSRDEALDLLIDLKRKRTRIPLQEFNLISNDPQHFAEVHAFLEICLRNVSRKVRYADANL